MIRSKRHTVLTVLVCLTVLLAGCSGWGTDGPVDEDAESNGSDDLEEADAEADDDATADGSDDSEADADDDADDGGADDGDPPESGTDDDESDATDDDETDAPEDDSDDETDAEAGDDASADEGDEADEAESDGTDGDDASADDGGANDADDDDDDEGDADENDGSTLTIETADVVTGEPIDADVISLEQDGETIGGESGESATFDGLADGEYDLEVFNSLGDWVYAESITIDGEDATHVAEIDQEHTYWPGVVVTVVDGDGEPVEGETVTINGEEFLTDSDSTVEEEIESNYTDEREFVVEYGEQSETVEIDWESWEGDHETVTFETENGGDADEDGDTNAALTMAA